MTDRRITEQTIAEFKNHLVLEEKSGVTIQKYLRDVAYFVRHIEDRKVSKQQVMEYKQFLLDQNYAIRSINSMLTSLNCLFRFLGWHDCRVKTIRVQREIFCSEEKELSKAEYVRLCHAASRRSQRLLLILQTLCSTGIRISELKYITVEAAKKSEASVSCKSKTRRVFLVRKLQKTLLRYAAEQGIESGSIFVTRRGKPMDRTNIWRELKQLSREAGVDESKVFPHNLRHLFARLYYGLEKDIASLADILGHSNINTTRIYIISTGTEHRRKMERLQLLI